MDESSALLASAPAARHDGFSRSAWTAKRIALGALGCAVATLATLFLVAPPDAARGLLANIGIGGAGRTRYILRTRCVPESLKSANPTFFGAGANLTGAFVTRHNLGSDSFFPAYERGMVMTPVTYDMTGYEWDWEEGRFALEVPEGALDNEWGFALQNAAGEVLYENGGDAASPLWGSTCRDIIRWDSPTKQWFNRFMGREDTRKIEYVFGGCDNTCPERSFNDWSDFQREVATKEVMDNTPNEVGSEFTMYGYAGDGVCQFDILVPGHYDPNDQYSQNRILHFAPADRRDYVHTNARKDHHWSGEKNWPGGWPFGPKNDPTSKAEWRVKIVLKQDTLELSSCTSWEDDSTCVVKANDAYQFGYSPSDISGVQTAMGYEDNYLRSDGKCDFYAKRPGAQKNPHF